MHLSFLADPAFTRKHARLIYRQFFPLYLRSLWLRWLLILIMYLALVEFISLMRADDQAAWLLGWGLPESFSYWRYGPMALIIGTLVVLFLAEWAVRIFSRKAETRFTTIAPSEQADFAVTETEVTMKSSSAHVSVPLDKVTGLALSKDALAIGFSGAGMIIPRGVFATPTEETAFLRAIAKGLNPGALQRSSEAVRKVL
jgi:hypothetical protein